MTRDFPAYRKDLKGLIAKLGKEAPGAIKGFGQLHEGAMKAGALDVKTKELIALGIGIASRCDGCIAFHTHEALVEGATREEIVETIAVGVLMGGGPSLMYSAHAMDALEQFEAAGVGSSKSA
ncbi:MAG: carboxymuconolactone decarboxylase family protein [Capsulimonadaceae bacterium]|nr:carboxymuconolactone decarboxylase family protein [Capsulimonadaceae bacterium]